MCLHKQSGGKEVSCQFKNSGFGAKYLDVKLTYYHLRKWFFMVFVCLLFLDFSVVLFNF